MIGAGISSIISCLGIVFATGIASGVIAPVHATQAFASMSQFQVPSLSGPVMDQAGMLRPQDRQQLERLLVQINSSGLAQIQVLTLQDLGGLPIEQASIKITDQWKLGDAKKDNGVLFLIAKAERKMRIEVGQGLEGSLPDLYAKRIITDLVAPYFRRGDYSAGILAGVNGILARISADTQSASDHTANAKPSAHRQSSNRFLFLIHFGLIMLVMFLRLFTSSFRRRSGMWGTSGHIPSTWGGGFGGGGGGWTGGGGGFSGGGASGDW